MGIMCSISFSIFVACFLSYSYLILHIALMQMQNPVYSTDRSMARQKMTGDMRVNLGMLRGCLLFLPTKLAQLKESFFLLSILSVNNTFCCLWLALDYSITYRQLNMESLLPLLPFTLESSVSTTG